MHFQISVGNFSSEKKSKWMSNHSRKTSFVEPHMTSWTLISLLLMLLQNGSAIMLMDDLGRNAVGLVINQKSLRFPSFFGHFITHQTYHCCKLKIGFPNYLNYQSQPNVPIISYNHLKVNKYKPIVISQYNLTLLSNQNCLRSNQSKPNFGLLWFTFGWS